MGRGWGFYLIPVPSPNKKLSKKISLSLSRIRNLEPDEINDIELATQLYLLDLNVKGKGHVADEDEELAGAIKESLKSSSNSKHRVLVHV
ncbi:hypothetical protein WN943_024612 [Citrus x changshan-huyou]